MNNTFKLAAVSSAALMIAAAPAMAQEGPTLRLGGYYDQKMSIQDQDSSAAVQSDVDVRNDVEIYFLGAATLDNGIKIATRVELEGGTNDVTTTSTDRSSPATSAVVSVAVTARSATESVLWQVHDVASTESGLSIHDRTTRSSRPKN